MTNRIYSHVTQLSDLDANAANRYRDAVKAVQEIQQELLRIYEKSDHKRDAYAIKKQIYRKGKLTPALGAPEFEGTTIVQRLTDDTPYVAKQYMDPKTVNLLLNGKLLTDGQKRELLKREYPQLGEVVDAPVPEPGALVLSGANVKSVRQVLDHLKNETARMMSPDAEDRRAVLPVINARLAVLTKFFATDDEEQP